jgi:hypothetical protein
MHARSRGVIVALWAATAAAAFGVGWITPPPHTSLRESPAPDDLVASIRSALGEGDVIERHGRTASLLERLDPEGVLEVAALYERMIPVIGSSELVPFFAAWARFDAVGALNHALSWSPREMNREREVGIRAAIQVWAQHNPLAARLAAVEIAADPRLRNALWGGLVTGWVHSHQGQEGLGAFIADLPPLKSRRAVIKIAIQEFLRKGGADAALGWAEPILRDEGYDGVFKRSIFGPATDLAAQWDPERTAAWTAKHLQAGYAGEGLHNVAKHWSRRDGAAAMAWLGKQPAGELRDKALREAFLGWSKTNPHGLLAWLNADELTPLHDPAFEIKATRLVAHEPVRALSWCERIQERARQQSCLESSAHTWYGRDAVAAETWLQQSSLDDEVRSRVRKIAVRQGQEPKRSGRQRAGLR